VTSAMNPNFALILFLLLLATGAVALADRLAFARRRAPGEAPPWWIEYPKSFFPVILIVFLLRSFLVEPFKIPSSSMRPTLEVGDFILVNKFAYGIRLPIVEKKVIETGQPKRGDVMVFRYPNDPSLDYIKRVVGLPGDEVAYREKRLTINGQPVPLVPDGTYSYLEGGLAFVTTQRFVEDLGGTRHAVAWVPDAPPVRTGGVRAFPGHERCVYNDSGFVCKVPEGQYLMLGDNRDNSEDSRYWGFVPDDHIRGKAFLIWWNLDDVTSLAFERVGRSIH
jgi:signal peptidase I